MLYTITFCEGDYEHVRGHLQSSSNEQAAYLMCRMSVSDGRTSLLVRKVIPVPEADIVQASPNSMCIGSRSYARAMKHANDTEQCLVFVHSHPGGDSRFSAQDDAEEAKFFRAAYVRIQSPGVHGSIVFGANEMLAARVWLRDGTHAPVDRLTIIGRQFQFRFLDGQIGLVPYHFDRQVRAFGHDIQLLLARLQVGVVGAGGTGSAVLEQLIRLGVGSILTADKDDFAATNINRVYGSRMTDDGKSKVSLVARRASEIGLGTVINAIPRSVTFESTLAQFRDCDVIFCCTDDDWGRSLLTQLAVYYYIPVIDMGVKIDAENGRIKSIQGRVTTLMPGAACLYCRERITAERVAADVKRETKPDEARTLAKEGYLVSIDDPDPAVIPFTTTVAAGAVTEFLHRLTGFLGDDRASNEVVYRIGDSKISTNARGPKLGCFCADPGRRGRGDATPFLDLLWRDE